MQYTKTHPWLTFSLRLPNNDHGLWLTLGEIASKIEHLSGAPLRPDIAKQLNTLYLAKGVLATTAIEGNTLSEEQVRLQIEGKLELPKSQKYLQQEIQNIIDVCNREAKHMMDHGSSAHILCRELIQEYNRGVLNDLALSEGTVPGQIRTHSVVVGSVYRGAPAEDCDYLLTKLCEWLNGDDFSPPQEELRIPFALIKAIIAHVYLAWIHPFGDGNGRTARLVEFHILFANGIPLPAAHLLSDHYNMTRSEYYRELAKSSASGGDVVPFIRYALQGFLDGIRQQIANIKEQQMAVAWENYVYDCFRAVKTSPTQKRRRELVFELTSHGEWTDVSSVPMLTPNLARDYAAAGDRMLQRDLNAVAKMGLVSRKHGKVKANKHIMQAFLPNRVNEQKK